MSGLLRLRGFLPYISILFLNAFVDLGHKIVIQNTIFKVHNGETQVILTAIVNALILLPFVVLFSPSGFLSDRFRKPRVMRWSALVAVGLTLVIVLAYYQGWYLVAFAMTFLLGAQAAIYSPAKYGYIKELAGTERLAEANAVVQAVTIVAILAGTLAFSILFEQMLEGVAFHNETDLLPAIAPIGWVLVICSVIEFALTLRLPETRPGEPDLRFSVPDYLRFKYLGGNLHTIRANSAIWLSIVGLSVFWGISQVTLAAFPALAKASLGELNTIVIQGIMACTGIGIVIGSLIAGRASRHYIETGIIPLGALGIVVGLALIPQAQSTGLLMAVFLGLGVAGGLFIVPLNALIQFHARDDQMGVVLAGNNWVQNVAMLGFLALTVGFALGGMDARGLFHLLTLAALIGAGYTVYKLPQSLIRYLITRILAGQYRLRVLGFDRIPAQGGVLMLGNHISWLDWAMVQIACPRPVHFVMARVYYDRWYLRGFLNLFGVIPISAVGSRTALARVNALLREGEVVCLFPEGTISRNGQLAEFKPGFERAAEGLEGSGTVILPFYLRGLWGSRFSRSSGRLQEIRNEGLRRDILCAFGPTMPINSPAHAVKQAVSELSIDAWQAYTEQLPPIPHAWIRTVKRGGGNGFLADARGDAPQLSPARTLTAAILFARLIARRSPEQNIGLLLPTTSAGVIANLACLLRGKTVVNLNYTASLTALQGAVRQAGIRSIYTSDKFLKRLAGRGIDLAPLFEGLQVIPLESLRDEIGPVAKLLTLAAVQVLPAWALQTLFAHRANIDAPAAILFSSGSEGDPKGVVLSHRNIMGNIRQISDVLNTQADEVVMASLPLFHAFGLTVTGLMPVVEGMGAVCHPDPTDVVNIAKAIARYKATVFCGTSTFLRLFVRHRKVHPLMLDPLRIVVAGAERLSPEVREAFELKFRKTLYEGYGATETTPVAGVNVPDKLAPDDWSVQTGSRPGTVGLPLPGSSFRICDPVTLAPLPVGEDGLILIGGTQVMLGYLNNPEKTAEVIVEIDGRRWYKTGDKGHLDADGFLTIVDRYSRFAKIGGEMISLGAVEAGVFKCLPEGAEAAAVAVPDGKKGERVVVLFSGEISPDELTTRLNGSDLNPLMRPAEVIPVEAIPKLGTGKTDYRGVKAVVEQRVEA